MGGGVTVAVAKALAQLSPWVEEPLSAMEPTVLDQELDTRATTGVVYWEGSQKVTTSDGVGAEAYVELTRYVE